MAEPRIHGPGSAPVRELHVWIGLFADGTELMLSAKVADFVSGMGMRTVLLMSTDRETGERLRRFAEQVRVSSLDSEHPLASIELRTFRVAAD